MSTTPAQVARSYVAPGTLWSLARNRDITTGVGKMLPQDIGVVTDRPAVSLQWELVAGWPVDHGEVADEAAMLALHTYNSPAGDTPLLRYVAPGDSCTRADDPGWRWHCISGHGQALADWERRPLTAALSNLAVTGHTHPISAVAGLQSALDSKQPTLTNAVVVAELADDDGALTYRGTPLGGGSASYGVSARVRRTSSFSVPSSTNTVIPFSEALWDTGGFWTAGSPTVFTIPADGVYLVGVQVIYATNSNGMRVVDVLTNASNARLNRTQVCASSGGSTALNATAALDLSAGDTISLGLWQNSGSAVDAYAVAGSDATSMSILRIG